MKRLRVKTFLTLFGAVFLIYFADGIGLLSPIKSGAQTVILPVQYTLFSTKQTIGDTFSFLTFWKSGEERIKNLELRNLELASAKNEAVALRRENNELRKQLGANILADKKLLPAVVLGNGRYLEIGVGESSAVKVGQTVVYINNLIGKIIRVTPKASFVQLITDPQAKIPVKVNKARGLTIGQFNSSIILDRVAQTEEINEGDLIFTSGEAESYPPDLVVGRLGKIENIETDLFQKAEVKPVVNYSELEMVFVISE